MFDIKSLNMNSLKKLASPNAAHDLNEFLESIPKNTGKIPLIIAGTIWAVALALCLLATVHGQGLTELRAELQETNAVKPNVPLLKDIPVDGEKVRGFAEKLKETYTGLEINAKGSTIEIKGDSTSKFGQFRESIGHIQNGGSGWRVSIETFCVGRECKGAPLQASLTINKVSVEAPK